MFYYSFFFFVIKQIHLKNVESSLSSMTGKINNDIQHCDTINLSQLQLQNDNQMHIEPKLETETSI